MNLDAHVEALAEDLGRIGAVGDDATARAAELLVTALEPALVRRLQEVLSQAALEVSSQLPVGRIELRIAGGNLELIHVDEPAPAGDLEAAGLDARITLRLPESLKARLELAAAGAGVSLNTWLVQALARLAGSPSHSGGGRRRLTGYGRS